MGYFFAHARGAVKRVEGPWRTDPMFRISVGGWPNKPGGGLFLSAICTQAGINANGNFQFLHTINDTIFVYVFGDRISELLVAGAAFGEPCEGTSGIAEIVKLYTQDRIAVKARPLIVTLGSASTFNSFLTGVNVEITDPETQIGQFSFRFHCFPATT